MPEMMPGARLELVEIRRNEIFDPDVICTACGARLCTAEDRDTLAVLVAVAESHAAECPGEAPEAQECEGCGAEAGEECRPMCTGLAVHLDELEGITETDKDDPGACFCDASPTGDAHAHLERVGDVFPVDIPEEVVRALLGATADEAIAIADQYNAGAAPQ